MELRLLLRNGENVLAAFGIPAGLLAFFSLVDVLPTGGGPAVDFLLPGVLVAAVMGSALMLAIEESYTKGGIDRTQRFDEMARGMMHGFFPQFDA
jgi:hypothetical protein